MSDKELTPIQEMRNRLKEHSELETKLMNSGPGAAQKIIEKQTFIEENYVRDVSELLELIDNAIYQFETLEPLLNIPERGYVRNNYRRAIMTLKGE